VDTNPLISESRTRLNAYNEAFGKPAADWRFIMDQFEACLAESTATTKYVVGHESPYGNGAEQSGYPELRSLFGPLFKKYGVEVHFAAHSHDLEHLAAPEGYHVVISGSAGGGIFGMDSMTQRTRTFKTRIPAWLAFLQAQTETLGCNFTALIVPSLCTNFPLMGPSSTIPGPSARMMTGMVSPRSRWVLWPHRNRWAHYSWQRP
jgi:hypothetical protein